MSTAHDTLGVAPGADPATVRCAYRRLALQYHPDRNVGNPEAEARFKSVADAYAELTGRGGKPDALAGEAVGLLAQCLDAVLAKLLADGTSVGQADVVALMRQAITATEANARRDLAAAIKGVTVVESTAARFVPPGDDNLLEALAEDRLRQARGRVKAIERALEVMARARGMLKGYSYKHDPPPPGKVFRANTANVYTRTTA